MKSVCIDFDIKEAVEYMNGEGLVGYQGIKTHVVFDVKMEDFWRKFRLVTSEHLIKLP